MLKGVPSTLETIPVDTRGGPDRIPDTDAEIEISELIQRAILKLEQAARHQDFRLEALTEHGQLLVNEAQYAKALPLLRRAYDIKPGLNLQSYIKRVEGAVDAQL